MNKICKYLLDIIFPNRCPFCDCFIKWDKLVCDKCKSEISYAADVCGHCGKYPCACGTELFYEKCYVVCYYEGIVKKGILNLKINNALNTAEFFADILSVKVLADGNKYDMIIPVPMLRKKLSERGYNQAEEIARFISVKTGISLNNKVLKKLDNEVEQHTLKEDERIKNVRNSYAYYNEINLKGKSILLCDDVMTSGSTLNECSRLIKNLGAKYVALAVGSTTKLKKADISLEMISNK